MDPRSNISLPNMDRVDQKWTWLEHTLACIAAEVSGLVEEAEATAILGDNPKDE